MKKSVTLDRLKESAVYAMFATLVSVFVTAALWWHIPSLQVLAATVGTFAVYTAIIDTVFRIVEHICIKAIRQDAKIKKTRGQYISAEEIRKASQGKAS